MKADLHILSTFQGGSATISSVGAQNPLAGMLAQAYLAEAQGLEVNNQVKAGQHLDAQHNVGHDMAALLAKNGFGQGA